jgi:hypothetical protein
MYRTIIFCDVCERELARGAPEPTPASQGKVYAPIGCFVLGGGISIVVTDAERRELANIGLAHACSKTCARALLSKFQSAIDDSPAREKP